MKAKDFLQNSIKGWLDGAAEGAVWIGDWVTGTWQFVIFLVLLYMFKIVHSKTLKNKWKEKTETLK